MLDIISYTNNGGHEINEDSYYVGEDAFVVCDGLGGHDQGEVASARAIECVKEYCTGSYTEDHIMELLNAANKSVLDLNSDARTTIAIAFIEDSVFKYANVGDSRVYLFRNGSIIAQSRDHSVCQAAIDMGTLRPEELRESEDRSSLLKVLGNDENLNIKKMYEPVELQDGDAFIVCSDGFWEYVYETEMEADLLKSGTAVQWTTYMLKRQLLRAHNEGDNYTLICGIYRADAGRKKRGLFSFLRKNNQ